MLCLVDLVTLTLKFDLLLQNFNFGQSLLTRRGRVVILHMCIPCGKTFQAVPWFLCPRHKMARGHLVFALPILPSFRPSVTSKFVFLTPPTSLHGFQWNLAGMLYHKSGSVCGELIHVRQISAELWPLTFRIFTHFSLSSQLLLHPCMDLNETWQGCCTTSLEVHVGR